MLPANGLGGSRATILFLFSFLKAAAAPALRALKQAGKKEGGWGGKEFLPACAFRAEGAVGVGAFPPFRQKRNIKTKKFSFP